MRCLWKRIIRRGAALLPDPFAVHHDRPSDFPNHKLGWQALLAEKLKRKEERDKKRAMIAAKSRVGELAAIAAGISEKFDYGSMALRYDPTTPVPKKHKPKEPNIKLRLDIVLPFAVGVFFNPFVSS